MKGNNTLAYFLGWKRVERVRVIYDVSLYETINENYVVWIDNDGNEIEGEVRFDKDYNLLMEVVKTIQDLDIIESDYIVERYDNIQENFWYGNRELIFKNLVEIAESWIKEKIDLENKGLNKIGDYLKEIDSQGKSDEAQIEIEKALKDVINRGKYKSPINVVDGNVDSNNIMHN